MSDELTLHFENKHPESKEWSSFIKMLNDYPVDMKLRFIVQYIRSGEFYPADVFVELIKSYCDQTLTAYKKELLSKAEPAIFQREDGTSSNMYPAIPLSAIQEDEEKQ